MSRAEALPRVTVSIAQQCLRWIRADGSQQREFPVSTAAAGVGQREGSGCTPAGHHVVRARIGEGCARGTVFVARRPTGEVWSAALAARYPGRDWILTRILWLSGTEPGFNRLGEVDTMRRYIYLHGTPDDQPMGVPLSHGCVRMRNDDVLWLFDHTPTGTSVMISPDADEESAPC